jgi:hypothetical protein
MIELTAFNNIYDNKTQKKYQFVSWESYTEFLHKLSKIKLKGKKNAKLISPAIYQPDETRSNKSVLSWAGWAALDVDDVKCGPADVTALIDAKYPGWQYVIYNTASSTEEKAKFRVVFPLKEYLPADKIRHFWHALNSLGEFADKQCKDYSRMYYTPGTYRGACNFFHIQQKGTFIDAHALMNKYEYVEKTGSTFMDGLSPEMQEKILEYRKAQMTNVSPVWLTYRDCPYWPKQLAKEYMTIAESGWYYKLYQIMVAVAVAALADKYPITHFEIASLVRDFHRDTRGWPSKRNLETEALRALEYVYRTKVI